MPDIAHVCCQDDGVPLDRYESEYRRRRGRGQRLVHAVGTLRMCRTSMCCSLTSTPVSLGTRAKAIHSTPGAVLQALISQVLQDAMAGSSHEGGPSVQAAFSGFAEQYSAVAESLGQTDPELPLGSSSEPSAAEDAPSSAEAPAGDTPDPSNPVDLTREDLHQAFAEFEAGLSRHFPAALRRGCRLLGLPAGPDPSRPTGETATVESC